MKLHDSAERSNRDLPGATANVWSWVVDSGHATSAWRIVNGRIARKGNSATSNIGTSKKLATENQTFVLEDFGDFVEGTSTLWFGLILRHVDTSNYHLVRVNSPIKGGSGPTIVLSQVGTNPAAAVTAGFTLPESGRFKLSGNIKREGSNVILRVYVNDALVATHTTTTAAAWPAGGGVVKLTGYANSARVDAGNNSFSFEDFLAQDTVQPSRYALTEWNGTAEVPIQLENVFIEYIVGERDPRYPEGLTEYPSDWPPHW